MEDHLHSQLIEVTDPFKLYRIRGEVPLYLRVWKDSEGFHAQAISPEHKDLIRKVFRAAAEERSLRVALPGATRLGLTRKDGQPPSFGTLYRFLGNQHYCGWVWHDRQLFRAVEDPIISEHEFWALQRKLASRRRDVWKTEFKRLEFNDGVWGLVA